MAGVFWGYTLFFTLCLGGIIGWICAKASSKIDDTELPKIVPTKEEVLRVMEVITATYRCTSYEKECMEEAHRLIESMMEEDEDECDE